MAARTMGRMKTPILEDLSKLEVDLPLGIPMPLTVRTIEAVAEIDAQRTQRSDERSAEAGTAKQPGRIEVPRPLPQIAGVVERVDVQLLADA